MNKITDTKLNKEVMRWIFGSSAYALRYIQGNTPYRFKPHFYDRIKDEAKKEIVQKMVLEILTTKYILPHKRLRCFTAYIASDIGLMEAKPIVEKMASEKSLQKSFLLLLVEKALEKLGIEYQFPYEPMKYIVIGRIKCKYEVSHGGGNAFYDFKRFYFDKIINTEKKEMIKKIIMDIITTESTHSHITRLCSNAIFVASDIVLTEAIPIIDKLILLTKEDSGDGRRCKLALEALKSGKSVSEIIEQRFKEQGMRTE